MRSRRDVAAAVLVCLVLPLLSWADGRGRLAYTMYASTVTYRVSLAWVDRTGTSHALPPSEAAAYVSSTAAPWLTGADSYRTVAQVDALRDHLADVARAVCPHEPAATVDIVLFEREGPNTTARVTCP